MKRIRWKCIENYPDYFIFSSGFVLSVKFPDKPRILKLRIGTDGYYRINLYNIGITKDFSIHQLVATHFIGLCPKRKECNHKNGIKANNQDWNLEYVTHQENMRHAIKLKLCNNRGENHCNAKLTNKKVKAIRILCKNNNFTQKQIGKLFGISQTRISKVVNYKSWKHVK